MLDGIENNDIIVGAYADGRGICPMLAAHRAGGRTSLISFAHAWDRFAFRDSRSKAARRATEREMRVLRAQLQASLLDEDVPAAELQAALAEHRELVAQRSAEPGDRCTTDRADELRAREQSAWVRAYRRLGGLQALARTLEDQLGNNAVRR